MVVGCSSSEPDDGCFKSPEIARGIGEITTPAEMFLLTLVTLAASHLNWPVRKSSGQ
jgi:hypothetical protein